MDWFKVKKEHIDQAIKKFIEEKPEYPEPRSYYLIYEGEKLPAKYIRGMAYSIATGEKLDLNGFNGGTETANFFKKYGYTVEQVSGESDGDKYSVNDAVWIATALLAAEQYTLNPNATREDMYFKQSDIVKRAQSLTTNKVASARVSWWTNADNEKHTQNYLRADSTVDPAARRLSMMDEFQEKTYPTGLNMSDEFEIGDFKITMEELLFFVKEQYPEVIKQMPKVEINYKGVLDYIGNNQEVPYSNPEATGLDPAEKNRLLKVKEKGQAVVAEMKKIAARCDKLFGLDRCLPIAWLDGSNTKTRKYLWAQMKYKEYEANPTSVSLFVEKNDDVTRYRISLEIKNDGTDKKTLAKYHSHLDMPKKDGMVYVSGSNEWGNPIVITDSVEDIKKKISSGEIRKVQLCVYVESAAEKTDEEYDVEVMSAVKQIIPYYEHVIGKSSDKVAYWPSLEESAVSYDKNMILYGPPGTGKTYSTAIYAVAICDQLDLASVKSMDYNEVMIRYRELLTAGRVAFTTFHQSYGYEEFIEGIKPVLDGGKDIGYTVEDGVFKAFCDDARMPENKEEKCFGDLWAVRSRAGDSDVAFDYEEYLYKNGVILVETNNENDKRQCNLISRMKKGDWVILGREYKIAALGVIDDEEATETECGPFHWQRKVNWLVTGLSATFADIGIAGGCFSNFAVAKSKYKVQNFYKLIKTANKKNQPYVFVIDEINRGNISKIFGELITLIEDTKREGMDEQASAVLPYSGEAFSVPANVYILGTMNTADRSIALMDTALRRRFQFVEMMPDANVLREIGADMVEDLDVAAMLQKINERITFLYDREHTIGHAFFTKLAKTPTIETLKSIFEKSVIPLLQEYFYEDYQKIQLVLGDNGKTDPSTKFILDEEIKVKNIFKGNADDVVDLPDKKYTINEVAFDNLESYKQII